MKENVNDIQDTVPIADAENETPHVNDLSGVDVMADGTPLPPEGAFETVELPPLGNIDPAPNAASPPEDCLAPLR